GVATSFGYTIYYLIVGQHRVECLAPPYLCIIQVCQAVLHEYISARFFVIRRPVLCAEDVHAILGYRGISFSFQQCNQCGYWFRFLTRGIIPAMKEFGENPLGPFIIVRVRSLDGSIPIVVKTDIIELLFIAGN